MGEGMQKAIGSSLTQTDCFVVLWSILLDEYFAALDDVQTLCRTVDSLTVHIVDDGSTAIRFRHEHLIDTHLFICERNDSLELAPCFMSLIIVYGCSWYMQRHIIYVRIVFTNTRYTVADSYVGKALAVSEFASRFISTTCVLNSRKMSTWIL